MKEYLLLYKTPRYNFYYNIEKNPSTLLRYLTTYFSSDSRYFDENLFTKDQSHYNETIIVNDLENRIFYILVKDFEIENHIDDDDRLALTNEFNSCKISHDNFMEFRQRWIEIKKNLPDFLLLYRDELDWVHCRGFASQADMEFFVKNYTVQVAH